MTDQTSCGKLFLGCDVSKNTINFALVDEFGSLVKEIILANTAKAIKDSLQTINRSFGVPILSVFEPTGNYEALLAKTFLARGWPCHKANTSRLSAFTKSLSNVKTDRADALAIAEYARVNVGAVRKFKPKNKILSQVRALADRRFDLIEMRKAEKQRAKAPAVSKGLVSSINKHIAYINRELARIEKDMLIQIKKDPTVSKVFNFLLEQQGVGQATALNLLAHFPEIGQLKAKQAVAMAGLAPIARDSGKKSGYRRTGYGRVQLRNALFMATLAVARKNGLYYDYFVRKTHNSGSKMKALIATAAKMLTVLNAKVRDFAIDNSLQLSR